LEQARWHHRRAAACLSDAGGCDLERYSAAERRALIRDALEHIEAACQLVAAAQEGAQPSALGDELAAYAAELQVVAERIRSEEADTRGH
jgi:hypothetical protein